MSLDLEYDDAQSAIAESIDLFCRDHCDEAVLHAALEKFPDDLWRSLADLGVLGVMMPESGSGAIELAAVMESLGRALFPGPLLETVYASQVMLPETVEAIVSGERMVTVGARGLFPWADLAGVFIELDDERAWQVEFATPPRVLNTALGDWFEGDVTRQRELTGLGRARTLTDIAMAAYLGAAADSLLTRTVEHARTRQQFGRAIGEFQAVSYPLADRSTSLHASRWLARAAADEFDATGQASSVAATARVSAAKNALETLYTCHQVFGAIGITIEGPVYLQGRRIRELISAPIADANAATRAFESFSD